MRRRAWLWLCGAVALLLALGVCWAAGVFAPPLTPGAPSERLLGAAQGLDESVVTAVLDAKSATLAVQQTLTLTNRTGQAQAYCVLRAWPNAFQSEETSPIAAEESAFAACYPDGFSMGALVMQSAQTDGKLSAYRYQDEAKTVLLVPVADGWQPDRRVTLTLSYTVHIPRARYRFGYASGVYALGNALLMPAVWEDGAWRQDAYAPVGDPFVSDCLNWHVRVTVPGGYHCAASAYARPTRDASGDTYEFAALAARDFALVVSEQAHAAQASADGVLVTAYAETGAQAKALCDLAADALRFFGARYGAYAWPSLTLSAVDFPYSGMEYPGLVMVGMDELREGAQLLALTVAHEVAHQWWYAAVGSDGWYQPWQDEALCVFCALEYMEHRYGAAVRDDLERRTQQAALRLTVPRGVTPGAPLDRFTTMSQYGVVVYDRGAALLSALKLTLGEGLDHFLAAYYDEYAFARATRADFEATLRRVTGQDLSALMRDYLDTSILN